MARTKPSKEERAAIKKKKLPEIALNLQALSMSDTMRLPHRYNRPRKSLLFPRSWAPRPFYFTWDERSRKFYKTETDWSELHRLNAEAQERFKTILETTVKPEAALRMQSSFRMFLARLELYRRQRPAIVSPHVTAWSAAYTVAKLDYVERCMWRKEYGYRDFMHMRPADLVDAGERRWPNPAAWDAPVKMYEDAVETCRRLCPVYGCVKRLTF